MRLLDLYCCQGGASAGYVHAGFDVVGVDIDPQPRYPYPFLRMDAIAALRRLVNGGTVAFVGRDEWGQSYQMLGLEDFDAIHTSPPCQLYSATQRIQGNTHPDLIGPTREALIEVGLPYVIENVMDAEDELFDPVMLCGAMFGLRTYRHRLFETNWTLTPPVHPAHVHKTTKMGRRVRDGEFMHVVGNFSGVAHARDVMRIDWMTRDGLRESIPPPYSEHVGGQLMEHIEREAVA